MRKIFYRIPILNKIVAQRDALLKKVADLESEKMTILEEDNGNDFRDIFLSPWTDEWKKFNTENHDRVVNLLENLKSGMDEDSKDVVDILWEKIIYLIPHNRYKRSFLYKINDFFTEEELKDQKKSIDLTKYKFPSGINIEEPIFSTKNGLVFLSENIIKKIKNRAIIDGGGYIGDSALAFCDYAPSKIYSFEPVDFLYNKLSETIALNGVSEIIEPVKLGLSDSEKEVKIFGIDSGASLHTSSKDNFQNIKTTTVDKFVSEKNIDVGLIKLDVEGSELEVIRGSLETINKYTPVLLISVYHRPEDFFFIKPLLEDLNLGYKFMMRKTSPFRITSETVLIGYVNK